MVFSKSRCATLFKSAQYKAARQRIAHLNKAAGSAVQVHSV